MFSLSIVHAVFVPKNPLKVKVKSFSHVQLFAISWTVAYQAPPSIGFSRQEYWSGLPSPSPGGLPDPGIEPGSLALRADSLPTEPPGNFHDKLSLSVSSVAQSCPTLCDSVNHSTPRVPYTARKSNQSILKEINPEYSLEGLMLKLKPPDVKSQFISKGPDAGKD